MNDQDIYHYARTFADAMILAERSNYPNIQLNLLKEAKGILDFFHDHGRNTLTEPQFLENLSHMEYPTQFDGYSFPEDFAVLFPEEITF